MIHIFSENLLLGIRASQKVKICKNLKFELFFQKRFSLLNKETRVLINYCVMQIKFQNRENGKYLYLLNMKYIKGNKLYNL